MQQAEGNSRWPATLALTVARRGAASRLVQCRHFGPLRLQRPFYPEGQDLAHLYLLHPPGGLVAGDELSLQLAVEAGAGALVTAPGATKVYRSGGGEVSVLQKFEVAAAASLEWLPHEVIVFDGARLKARSRVSLATGARFIGFETLCLGRPASGLPFSLGNCDSRLDIEVAGRTLLHERQYWTPETLSSASAPAGLGGHSYVGSLYAWPGDARALTAARAALAGSSVRAGVTLLDGLLVVRALAASLPVMRRLLVQAWEALRPIVIGRAASPPRIWAT